LLTGATGLLGRYVLAELLARLQPVTVLCRDSQEGNAGERIRALVGLLSELFRRTFPIPTVLAGDLGVANLGLTSVDRQWLSKRCQVVVHGAASLSFRQCEDGEPWLTNVEGTSTLLEISRQLGLDEWHYVSTAFVCGRRSGEIGEVDFEVRPDFHNQYERSKHEAERRVRDSAELTATIYRPSIIVGDSQNGYTSNYSGLYRFFELAARLAEIESRPCTTTNQQLFVLRLPLTGQETCNLVPVNWLARAVAAIITSPGHHGRTYHLVSRTPTTVRLIHQVAAQVLRLKGISLAGSQNFRNPTRTEQLFLETLEDYWPYLTESRAFLCHNTERALAQLQPPEITNDLLRRLVEFGIKDRWGHRPTAAVRRISCADYIERQFPAQARQSPLARAVGLHLAVSFDIRGPGGGQWSCRWTDGDLTYVRRGLEKDAEVSYQIDPATFDAIIKGQVSPQQAFFQRRIDFTGNPETALKLAVLFEQFLRDNASLDTDGMEAMHAAGAARN
jgi:thioester reductase-like protein